MRRLYGAGAARINRLRLQWWALMTDLKMRGQGGRFKLELPVGRVYFRKLPYVRIKPGGRGGTTVMSIGADAALGDLSLDISAAGDARLSIGPGCEFEHGVRLQALGQLILGPNCEIRDNVTLKTSHPGSHLELGESVKLGRSDEVHCHERVQIDDRVQVGERVTIVDTVHDIDGSDVWTMDQPITTTPVYVGRNVIIFVGAIILSGASVGRNSVIAAYALMGAGTHPPGHLYVGAPAKAVRRLPKAADDESVPGALR